MVYGLYVVDSILQYCRTIQGSGVVMGNFNTVFYPKNKVSDLTIPNSTITKVLNYLIELGLFDLKMKKALHDQIK